MDSTKLKVKQLDILRYLFRFRFLTSHQLQHLTSDTSLRLTNYHLKTLQDLHYISKHYTRTLGLGNQPAIYYLVSGSIKALEGIPGLEKSILKRIYREKIRSQQFIDHSLLVANYFIYLLRESLKTGHTLHFYTKTDLQTHRYMPHPLPDAYFSRVDSQGNTKRYFVEIVDEGAPRFTVRKRVAQYSDYLDEGTFEEVTSHPFPSVLFICPTLGLKIYLKKHLLRQAEETLLDTISIYVATREEALSGKWEPVDTDE